MLLDDVFIDEGNLKYPQIKVSSFENVCEFHVNTPAG